MLKLKSNNLRVLIAYATSFSRQSLLEITDVVKEIYFPSRTKVNHSSKYKKTFLLFDDVNCKPTSDTTQVTKKRSW